MKKLILAKNGKKLELSESDLKLIEQNPDTYFFFYARAGRLVSSGSCGNYEDAKNRFDNINGTSHSFVMNARSVQNIVAEKVIFSHF